MDCFGTYLSLCRELCLRLNGCSKFDKVVCWRKQTDVQVVLAVSWVGIGLGKAMPHSWALDWTSLSLPSESWIYQRSQRSSAWPFGSGRHAEVGPMLEKSQRVHSQVVSAEDALFKQRSLAIRNQKWNGCFNTGCGVNTKLKVTIHIHSCRSSELCFDVRKN